MPENARFRCTLLKNQAGGRLDKTLAELFPDYSRSCLQDWLRQGYVTVDGQPASPRHKVRGGELVELDVPARPSGDRDEVRAEPLALSVVYQDDDLLVIDKPAGLVVHPAAGNPGGTLQNALLYHYPELAAVPRAGLVHRLDKDTSGVLAVARSLRAHKSLVDQLQRRSVGREYIAVVQGRLIAGGMVDAPIGRHPQDRKRMSVREGGRPAVTHYRVDRRFRHHTRLSVRLETGRTHQIRVHMAHLRRPLLGDPVYGGRLRLPPDCSPALEQVLRGFRRQALHAARLGLQHPVSGKPLAWSVPIPDDLKVLLEALEEDADRHAA